MFTGGHLVSAGGHLFFYMKCKKKLITFETIAHQRFGDFGFSGISLALDKKERDQGTIRRSKSHKAMAGQDGSRVRVKNIIW